MAGPLDTLNSLYETYGQQSKQSYESARSANSDLEALYSKPRESNPWFGLASAMLKPTRSGSAWEGIGNAAGYMDSHLNEQEERELSRAEKLARIRAAQANLSGGYAKNQLDIGLDRLTAPQKALQIFDATEDYNDAISGNSGIPAFPGTPVPNADPEPVPTPDVPDVPPAPPPPAPTSGAPLPAPNATVGSAGSNALIGGTGQDSLAPGAPQPQPPQGQPPQQVAQAQPQQRPAPQQPPQQPVDPIKQYQQQQYLWALQVRQAAAQDPGKWARRPKNKFALEQANKIIDDHRAQTSQDATSQYRADMLDLREKVQGARESGSLNKDPFEKAIAEGEAKAILKSREDAEAATKAMQNLDIVRELRKRPIATGPIGQYATKVADWVGMGGGQALEGRGADLWVQAVEPLKGALSNQEGARFDAANPGNLSMNDDEADILMRLGKMAAQRLQQKNSFIETYHRNNGSLTGAEQAWQRFLDSKPLLRVDEDGKANFNNDNVGNWQEFAGTNPALAKRAPTDSAPGRQISAPRISTREEYDALQKGQPYIDPKGNQRIKQ